MKILKFKLWGKSAFFKKPDVNTYLYFTYSNIHKVALLGIFGAILGYRGYNQMTKGDDFPEFYEKLKDLKIGIEPKEGSKGVFSKKIQLFNNSVGYASKEQGGNLIIKEQWLENPEWNIYVLINSTEAELLEKHIKEYKCTFIPYLGKNDHLANIEYLGTFDGERVNEVRNINSLVQSKYFEFDEDDEDDNMEECVYKYTEMLPIKLDKETNIYEYESFIYTNMFVDSMDYDYMYKVDNKNIMFF